MQLDDTLRATVLSVVMSHTVAVSLCNMYQNRSSGLCFLSKAWPYCIISSDRDSNRA